MIKIYSTESRNIIHLSCIRCCYIDRFIDCFGRLFIPRLNLTASEENKNQCGYNVNHCPDCKDYTPFIDCVLCKMENYMKMKISVQMNPTRMNWFSIMSNVQSFSRLETYPILSKVTHNEWCNKSGCCTAKIDNSINRSGLPFNREECFSTK